ncbi:MAG: Na/Pi cotransporter family protein [Rhodospirillales bacterium]|nr:Na/Pi cotransporter family protein [Rhodospirillales bacterium]MCW8861639.1 Na/Pi cotransporter family protein [Rhodospirillales bacterium]MCW8951705.1 Na/Pi cotransporter family protein [Rhodospirillales bacterium]MCW8969711.1 Na/Pi cotransporter family protein [Rhodospirillales bacterium]MCW9001758.1 Na/Pi cotransporter family protein [Rhodospirillales bacterium]
MSNPVETIEFYPLLAGLSGGLALFLFGMDQLSSGLKAMAGESMKALLGRLTTNRFLGLLTGAFVTAVIQSSSVTTVVVVGFISAGVMTLSQAIGVIIGANIGTTVTAQIIASNVSALSLPMIAGGFAMLFFTRRGRVKHTGTFLMGLGLIFFGMSLMSDAMSPLRTYEPFMEAMAGMESPIKGILVGAAFTAIIQSSAATTGIVIVLASQGLITLEGGIALALGANIGTCVTAILASIGKPRESVQAALAHVFFNVGGVVVWIGFIDQLAGIVEWILAAEGGVYPSDARAIATAHTVFNVVNAALFIGFTTPLAVLLRRMLPEESKRKPAKASGGRFLDPELLGTPSLALNAARMEVGAIGETVQRMLTVAVPAALTGRRSSLEGLAHMDVDVDMAHRGLVEYLRRLGAGKMSENEGSELVHLVDIANHLENIGDVIETDLVHLGFRRLDTGVETTDHVVRRIARIHDLASESLALALKAVTGRNGDAARRVIAMNADINRLAAEIKEDGLQRLITADPDTIEGYSREVEAVECLRRIFYNAKQIAKAVVTEEEAVRLEAAAATASS